MANVTINNLPLAATIDAAQDFLPIYTDSLVATQRINRSTLLGITGNPVGTSDAQVLTNKTIGNTNTLTAKDTLFTLQDDGDITKQARFQLSSITTATTRTYTLPDVSDTFVTLGATQTLTNKTLTSPTISGPTITNATISADAITGFTNASNGTIYGIAITGSAIQSSTAFADSIILPKALVAGTGSTWVWAGWTPTWTNITVGNGTVTARYIQIGKTVHFYMRFVLGSTSVVSGQPIFSLPVNANANYALANAERMFNVHIEDNGTSSYYGRAAFNSASTIVCQVINVAGTYASASGISSTVPMTWTTSDTLSTMGTYEVA